MARFSASEERRRRGLHPSSAAWLVAGFLGACALPTNEGLDRGSSSIVDGEINPGDPSVVYLDLGEGGMCTGAVLSPTVVLTAKHCIQDEWGTRTPASSIRIGQGASMDSGTIVAGVREVRAPGGAELDGTDIAVLVLDRAVTLTPYEWVRDRPPLVGAPLVGIGYGQNGGASGEMPAGVKYRGESTIGELWDAEFITGSVLSCYGDSGGPGFLPDGRIFGVVSRGTADRCDATDRTIYTRTDAFVELIEGAIMGAPAPDPGTDPGAPPGDPGADPWTDPGGDPGAPPGGDPGAPPGGDPGAPPDGDPGAPPGGDPWGDPGGDPGGGGGDACSPFGIDYDLDGTTDEVIDPSEDWDGDGCPDDPWCAEAVGCYGDPGGFDSGGGW